MQAYVEGYLRGGTEERGECVASMTELIKRGEENVLHVVQALQEWLISEDDSRRAQGTRLLTDVVNAGSGVLSPGDVHHLAHFLAARLMDWPCVEQAALGCTALLLHYSSRHQASHSTLTDSDALMIVRTAATGMAPQVQALAQPQRSACLRLLLLAIQDWGPAALRSAQGAGAEAIGGTYQRVLLDLLGAAIAAVDGEKDPRCLLASFQLLQAAVKAYHAPGVDPAQLSSQAEEVVEVLSCYFPVSFTPPKNDPFKITRDDLARGLQACMASSPFLARWVLPLVLEKLSSTYRPAKEDALNALTTCCCSYGIDALQPHLPAVWSALRNEVVVAPSAFGVVGGEELNTKRALAAKSAACLTHIMARVPPAAAMLQHLATKDACTQDLITLIEDSNGSGSSVNKGSDPDRANRVVMCNASLLGAVCGGSVAACEHVVSTLLPRILAMLPPSSTYASLHEAVPMPTGPDQVAVTRSKSWASTKVMYCLTVVRGIVRGVESALQVGGPHSSRAAAPMSNPELSHGQNNGGSVQQQRHHHQHHQLQQLCSAYLAVLAPRLVDPIAHVLSEALHAVGPACLGTAMQVDKEDDAAEEGGESTDVAPQVLLACISLWQALLSLHCTCSVPPAAAPSSTSAPAAPSSTSHTTTAPPSSTPHAPGAPSSVLPLTAALSSTSTPGLLNQAQLADCVHTMTRWALVTDAPQTCASAEWGTSGDEEMLPEGVVTAAPCCMEWKAPQAAHLEALGALQQALVIAEGREAGHSAGISSSGSVLDDVQGVGDATQSSSADALQESCSPAAQERQSSSTDATALQSSTGAPARQSDCTGALHGHVLQQLCSALLGSASMLPSTGAEPHTAAPSHPRISAAERMDTAGGGHLGSGTAQGMDMAGGGTQVLNEHLPPPPQPVRARALHAASALASGSPSLALAMQAMVSPLLLQLLAEQAGQTEGGLLSAARMWAAVTQELLVLVSERLAPAWPQPLPPHQASALSAFVTTLLELPLGNALLRPAAAVATATTEAALRNDADDTTGAAAAAAAATSATAAAAVKHALAAACAPCSNLTARCSVDEQRVVAMAACEAVAHASVIMQNRATAAVQSPLVAAPDSPQVLAGAPEQQQQQQHSQEGARAGVAQPARVGAASDAMVVGDLARACAACSAIAGLQPDVLAGAHVLQLVDALCDLATCPGFGSPCSTGATDQQLQQQLGHQGAEWARSSVSPDLVLHELQRAAAVALASVLNKWPGPGEELDGLACRVLKRWGLQSLLQEAGAQEGHESASSDTNAGARWQALAWTTRALAMRGNSRPPALLQHVVDCLASLNPSAPHQQLSKGESPPPLNIRPDHQPPINSHSEGSHQPPISSRPSSGPGPAAGEAMAVDDGPQGKDTALHALSDNSWGLAAAGAGFFRIVVSGAGDGAWHHARTRILWQQRTLAACLSPLLGALGRTPHPSPYPVTTPALALAMDSRREEHPKRSRDEKPLAVPAHHALLLAFASLVASIQLGLLRIEAPRIVDPLMAALHELPALAGACEQLQNTKQADAFNCGAGKEEPGGGSSVCVQADVDFVQGARELEGQVNVCLEGSARVLEQLLLRDAQLRPLLEEHVEQLVSCLATLMSYQGWPAVREIALRCAMLLLELPYHLLHPHRLVVVRAVTRALDDDKRSVRLLAVRCRRCWVPK